MNMKLLVNIVFVFMASILLTNCGTAKKEVKVVEKKVKVEVPVEVEVEVEVEPKDFLALERAKNKNTVNSYKQFIKNHPDSKYLTDANNLLTKKAFYNAKEENTIEAYDNFTSEHKTNDFTQQTEKLKQLLNLEHRLRTIRFSSNAQFLVKAKAETSIWKKEFNYYVKGYVNRPDKEIIQGARFLLREYQNFKKEKTKNKNASKYTPPKRKSFESNQEYEIRSQKHKQEYKLIDINSERKKFQTTEVNNESLLNDRTKNLHEMRYIFTKDAMASVFEGFQLKKNPENSFNTKTGQLFFKFVAINAKWDKVISIITHNADWNKQIYNNLEDVDWEMIFYIDTPVHKSESPRLSYKLHKVTLKYLGVTHSIEY